MRNIKIIIITLLFAALMGQGAVKQAWAIGIDLKNIEPLTPVEYIPDAEFEEKTQQVEDTPRDDNFLSYSVRLPKGWTESAEQSRKTLNSGLSNRVLGTVARYTSPPNKHLRSSFTLEAVELTYEVGARNWFINYVLSKGMTLNQIGKESRQQVEAIYVEIDGDTTYIVRVVAVINGSRMMVARYFVPQALYDEERVQQAQVLKSFELTNKEEVGVEQLEIFGFLDQSYFDYPVSWRLNAPTVTSIERMKATVYRKTVTNKLDGQIRLYLANKMTGTTRSKEVRTFLDTLKIEDYTLGQYIETPTLEYHKDMDFGITQAYQMRSQRANQGRYELWVSILEAEEYIYVVSLLTPAREEKFYEWARNIEAYRLLMKSVRRNDNSVNRYQFIK